MTRRISIVFLATLISGLILFVGQTMANQQHALTGNSTQQVAADNDLPSTATGEKVSSGEQSPSPPVRAGRRISIPYGFADNLPLLSSDTISVTGPGSCTEDEEGEEVTVNVTITQTIGGSEATGSAQFEEPCSVQSQMWQAVVQAEPGDTFVTGPAMACGLATTRADGEVTDVRMWCKAVTLNWQIYLPTTIK